MRKITQHQKSGKNIYIILIIETKVIARMAQG